MAVAVAVAKTQEKLHCIRVLLNTVYQSLFMAVLLPTYGNLTSFIMPVTVTKTAPIKYHHNNCYDWR